MAQAFLIFKHKSQLNPGGCETARFSLYLSRKYTFGFIMKIYGDNPRCETRIVLFKAISLRSDGPKFSDVQVTITEKMCDCGPNSPEITESLPGCYNGTRIYSKAGANSHPVPLFEYAKKLFV